MKSGRRAVYVVWLSGVGLLLYNPSSRTLTASASPAAVYINRR
jgi:hypothetical protein